MLTSVNRCLQLVKIFLGFTKASYQLDSSKVLASDMIPFRNCWDYAMQLLRTRLVSASLRLQFHWDVKNAFSVGNSNILTMMLYWLLSQFVNIVERKVLISRAKSIDQHIRIGRYSCCIYRFRRTSQRYSADDRAIIAHESSFGIGASLAFFRSRQSNYYKKSKQ